MGGAGEGGKFVEVAAARVGNDGNGDAWRGWRCVCAAGVGGCGCICAYFCACVCIRICVCVGRAWCACCMGLGRGGWGGGKQAVFFGQTVVVPHGQRCQYGQACALLQQRGGRGEQAGVAAKFV